MRTHNEKTLPKWAQDELATLRLSLDLCKGELKHLKAAHDVVLGGREWFTIPGPDFQNGEQYRYLWVLSRDGAGRICSLYPGDILLVGRCETRVAIPVPAAPESHSTP